MKKFLISIDTEGDNLWKWKPGDAVTSENAKFLPRFQELCEEYGFVPTYLTNYEMASDPFFADYFGRKSADGLCEIGMHLHAWNSPPLYGLPARTDTEPGASYLIEYPAEVMEEKIAFMTGLLAKTFGKNPVSHRAGRWTMNDTYFSLLAKYGYTNDCSVTPGISWAKAPGLSEGSFGSDWKDAPVSPYMKNGILEIPLTVRGDHHLHRTPGEGIRKVVRNRYRSIKGQGLTQLRPDGRNLESMLWLTESIAGSRSDGYIMFMLHSSEFMSGGNTRFTDEASVDSLYADIGKVFAKASQSFEGMSIGDYAAEVIKNG